MKQTLLNHRKQKTTIQTSELAAAAGVSIGEAYAVEIGGFAQPAVVDRVLSAFNKLSGLSLTQNDISLNSGRRLHEF